MSKPTLGSGILNKMVSARYMLNIAESELGHSSEVSLLAAINILQDSIELFLMAIMEYLDISRGERVTFYDYIDKINTVLNTASLTLTKLPFQNELGALNRLRVASKHSGTIPNRNECSRMIETARAFTRTVCDAIFKMDFLAITLIDFLQDGPVKKLLQEAEKNLVNEEYASTLINCRKALYLELERDYDIRSSAVGNGVGGNMLSSLFCRSPYYARNQEYIDKYVKEPTDYIVVDSLALNTDLLKYKINLADFYEIFRLTPQVYKFNDAWIVKEDFQILDNETAQENADYVLNKTVEMILLIHENKKDRRKISDNNFVIKVKKGSLIPIFEKADIASKIIDNLPLDHEDFSCGYKIDSLNGDQFHHVTYRIEDKYTSGYISTEHVVERYAY